MNNVSNNAQRSTLWLLPSVSTLLFKILWRNDRNNNGGVSVEAGLFSSPILSFICHVKRWARRCSAFVWSCSSLAVTLISPILACRLMNTVYTNHFSLILVSPALSQLLICCKCWSVAIFNVDCRGNLGYFFSPTFLLTCLF